MSSMITIDDHQIPSDTHNTYSVHIGNDTVHTLVTSCPLKITDWVSKFKSTKLLIGLDIEWLPNRFRNQDNPAATLQLCIADECLILQLLYCHTLPQSLFDFLAKKDSTFFGVGINHDVQKLFEDYGLVVGGKVVDLATLASQKNRGLKKAGLKGLTKVVLGMEIQKPKRISCSRWDQERLYPEQVQYACVDAFLSYQIGKVLNASGNQIRKLSSQSTMSGSAQGLKSSGCGASQSTISGSAQDLKSSGCGASQSTMSGSAQGVKSSGCGSSVVKVWRQQPQPLSYLEWILNKSTTDKFDLLKVHVSGSWITTADILSYVVSSIFEKAITEPPFIAMYAKLCSDLNENLPSFPYDEPGGNKISFKSVFLSNCQRLFESSGGLWEEVKQMTAPEQDAERRVKQRLVELRTLGNVRLIGELLKMNMITERIGHEIIKKLLENHNESCPPEENVETLCNFFNIIGNKLDHQRTKKLMDIYYSMLEKLSTSNQLAPRLRFMVQDVINLRNCQGL